MSGQVSSTFEIGSQKYAIDRYPGQRWRSEAACGGRIRSVTQFASPGSLVRTDGHATVRPMRELLILAIHVLVTFAKLVRPGGARRRRRVSPAQTSASNQ